jgi:hypothetical protein
MGVVSAQCVSGQRNVDGSLSIQWGDGQTHVFESLEQAREFANIDNNPEGVTLAKRLTLAKALALDPSLSDTSQLVGKVCTINPGAPNPVQIG